MPNKIYGVLDVYVAPIPQNARIEKVYPETRYEEIRSCASEKVRIQKYLVWKLLESAVADSFGLNFNSLEFKKDKSGKWSCGKVEFSLSHSANAVAVAVSDKEVGVDIELVRNIPYEKLAQKILTQSERAVFAALEESEREGYILERWTRKESLYKRSVICAFSQADVDGQAFLTRNIEIQGEKYVLSVCAEAVKNFRLINYHII